MLDPLDIVSAWLGFLGDTLGSLPARARQPHGPHCAYLHGEEVGAHPGGVANRDAVEEHEPDDEDKDDYGWCGHCCSCDGEGFGVDWDEAEGHGYR